jgi:eukaryotic-like serine/threonine-protein kinase
MAGILVPFIVFASVTAWVLGPKYLRMWHEQKLRQLQMNPAQGPANARLLVERAALEDRLKNLESIVCSVDFELNAKLNRLASRQLLLPAGATGSGSTGGRPPEPVGGSHPPKPPPTDAYAPTVTSAGLLAVLDPGQRVADRFVVERLIGAGGMGAVYLARDEKLGEPVALKVIRNMQTVDPQVFDRFKREVTMARRISHPNVVRLHDLGEWEQILFISMEYVQGESLRDIMKRTGALPPDRVRSTLGQICDGLEAAHVAGVVHRDLKPENVLIAGPDRVKIIDFGIAKMSDLEGMTATRFILGTPRYMSPEQIRGKTVDARADLYALGVVTYEALVGSPPFDGPSPIALSFAQCTEPAPTLASRRPGLSPEWEAFVHKSLGKEPSERFQSAAEMRAALPRA